MLKWHIFFNILSMKAVWSGSISFGLVNVPVKMFSATQSSTLDLDMLDKKDHSNIRFKRVNENTGREVPYKEIVKGYNYDGNYIVLDDEDFESAAPEKTKMIEILNFVKEEDINSMYYEQPYYLEPEKSAMRAYAILRDALRASHKVGVSSFVMRSKETLAVVKPIDEVLVLNRIRFEEEIRDFKDLNLPDIAKSRTKEIDVALKLIDQLTEEFDISKYKNTYTEKLLHLIEQKAKGKKPKTKKLRIVHTKTDDLMETLKASLSGKKKAS
jgi:DNA end-binding protein Ku